MKNDRLTALILCPAAAREVEVKTNITVAENDNKRSKWVTVACRRKTDPVMQKARKIYKSNGLNTPTLLIFFLVCLFVCSERLIVCFFGRHHSYFALKIRFNLVPGSSEYFLKWRFVWIWRRHLGFCQAFISCYLALMRSRYSTMSITTRNVFILFSMVLEKTI